MPVGLRSCQLLKLAPGLPGGLRVPRLPGASRTEGACQLPKLAPGVPVGFEGACTSRILSNHAGALYEVSLGW